MPGHFMNRGGPLSAALPRQLAVHDDNVRLVLTKEGNVAARRYRIRRRRGCRRSRLKDAANPMCARQNGRPPGAAGVGCSCRGDLQSLGADGRGHAACLCPNCCRVQSSLEFLRLVPSCPTSRICPSGSFAGRLEAGSSSQTLIATPRPRAAGGSRFAGLLAMLDRIGDRLVADTEEMRFDCRQAARSALDDQIDGRSVAFTTSTS